MRFFAEEPDEDDDDDGQETMKEMPRDMNLFNQKLLETRTILLFGEINMKVAEQITRQLLILAADSDEDIKLYVNSPGGHVESGDTIFDMIRFVKPRVKIIGTGWVANDL